MSITTQSPSDVLLKADKKLKRLINSSTPFELEIPHLQSTFEALAESIVFQQLSGKAAASIFKKLKLVCGAGDALTHKQVLNLSVDQLRSAGLSGAKTTAIIDLATKTRDKLIPDVEALKEMTDEEIVERLTLVKGIGKWTVEMLLIFRLGRLDILPSADYGVRKGFALTYGLKDLPKPSDIVKHGERWRPFRTVGSWYMWRAAEKPADFWD